MALTPSDNAAIWMATGAGGEVCWRAWTRSILMEREPARERPPAHVGPTMLNQLLKTRLNPQDSVKRVANEV